MQTTTPAHVIEDSYQQTGIVVVGGSNWDLSRSAVETPVNKLSDKVSTSVKPCYCEPMDISYEGSAYRVKDSLPSKNPDMTLQYTKSAYLLTTAQKKVLNDLSPTKGVIVVGNSGQAEPSPSELASKRVSEVVKYLKSRGVKVYFSDSFGASRPVTTQEALDFKNARIDIWVQIKGSATE